MQAVRAFKTSVLYISYDGVLEPLGESQVLGYLERLSGYALWVLSFEKPQDLADAGRVAVMRRRLDERGIRWIPLRYTKRPPVASTAWDIARGVWRGRTAVRGGAALVHARG